MTENQFRMDSIKREPAWLTALIDQDIQRIKVHLSLQGTELPPSDVIMLMLGEYHTRDMTEAERYAWNETCDGCGQRFVDAMGLLYCNAMRDWDEHTLVCITFAACLDCLAKP